jgi:hypothetical protein
MIRPNRACSAVGVNDDEYPLASTRGGPRADTRGRDGATAALHPLVLCVRSYCVFRVYPLSNTKAYSLGERGDGTPQGLKDAPEWKWKGAAASCRGRSPVPIPRPRQNPS